MTAPTIDLIDLSDPATSSPAAAPAVTPVPAAWNAGEPLPAGDVYPARLPAISATTPQGYAAAIDQMDTMVLPKITPIEVYGPRGAPIRLPSPYVVPWTARITGYFCVTPLDVIPPRFALPRTDRYDSGLAMASGFLRHLRPLFGQFMPAPYRQQPGGDGRRAYDSYCFVLLNKVKTLQLHPAEALAIHFELLRRIDPFLDFDHYWSDRGIRRVIYNSFTLRQWLHEHGRVMTSFEYRCMARYVWRTGYDQYLQTVETPTFGPEVLPGDMETRGFISVIWQSGYGTDVDLAVNMASMVPSSRHNPVPGTPAQEQVKSLFDSHEPPAGTTRLVDFLPYLARGRQVAMDYYNEQSRRNFDYVYEYVDVSG